MDNIKNKLGKNPVKIIFFVQLGLIVLLAILFAIGRIFDTINVGVFFFSIIIGAIGASISLFKRIRNKDIKFINEHDEIRSLAIFMPILYGALLSGVSYLFFMSGILSGDGGDGLLTTNLFPNFNKTDIYNEDLLEQFIAIKPSSMQDTGKLLIWSFLSGYSEQFVTKILNELESKSKV